MAGTNKLVKALHQEKSMAFKKKSRKARDAALNELDKDKFSTKAKKGLAKVLDKGEDFIDEAVDFEAIDKGAGKAVDFVADKAKKAGKAVGVTADRAKRAGSWVKKNKGKVALGVGAAAGVAMAAKDDNKSLKSQLRRIRAKDPSERTASEKRLLRLMED
jgi:hypothetical protein